MVVTLCAPVFHGPVVTLSGDSCCVWWVKGIGHCSYKVVWSTWIESLTKKNVLLTDPVFNIHWKLWSIRLVQTGVSTTATWALHAVSSLYHAGRMTPESDSLWFQKYSFVDIVILSEFMQSPFFSGLQALCRPFAWVSYLNVNGDAGCARYGSVWWFVSGTPVSEHRGLKSFCEMMSVKRVRELGHPWTRRSDSGVEVRQNKDRAYWFLKPSLSQSAYCLLPLETLLFVPTWPPITILLALTSRDVSSCSGDGENLFSLQ